MIDAMTSLTLEDQDGDRIEYRLHDADETDDMVTVLVAGGVAQYIDAKKCVALRDWLNFILDE